ncbi:MAG: hypothetical protein ACWIPH_04545 [Ostreibacterium sp.]
MKILNQQQVIKQRRRFNFMLTILLLGFVTWIIVLFYREIEQNTQIKTTIESVTNITIKRNKDTIMLVKKGGGWLVNTPYQSLASNVVVEALLGKLSLGCQMVSSKQMNRELKFYATVITNNQQYQVGELNSASNKVYVKVGDELQLCDKLLASMVLAPAINYMDKSLYKGELERIKGSFGAIDDFSGIDLSVLEIAPANVKQVASVSVSNLTFLSSEGKKTYRVLPPDASQHLFLFDPKKSVIFVIAANLKINAVLGL